MQSQEERSCALSVGAEVEVDKAEGEVSRLWSRVEMVQELCILYEEKNQVMLADSLCH